MAGSAGGVGWQVDTVTRMLETSHEWERYPGMGILAIKGLEPQLRGAFADACEATGPAAPTLCAGWTVRDLAIHLDLIERRWDSWAAVPLGRRFEPIRRTYDALVERERSREWPENIARIRSGPGAGPLASQWLRDRMMPREYLIHTEDIRRANGITATVSDDAQEAAWSRLPGLAKRMFLIPAPFGLVLAQPDGRTLTLRNGSPTATLRGEPLELLLYVFGRTTASGARLEGDPDAAAAAHVRDMSRAAQSLPRVSDD
jgi:uncharacterized protein (TIGR03085 family)